MNFSQLPGMLHTPPTRSSYWIMPITINNKTAPATDHVTVGSNSFRVEKIKRKELNFEDVSSMNPPPRLKRSELRSGPRGIVTSRPQVEVPKPRDRQRNNEIKERYNKRRKTDAVGQRNKQTNKDTDQE